MSQSSSILLQTRRFQVVSQQWRDPDGKLHQRETIQHSGAVTIIPMVDRARVCLIRNFRVAVGETLIELPAGTRESGEHPALTARRELAEETGYVAGELSEFFMSPGILNERMSLFLATDLMLGETQLDEGEQIERLVVPWREALQMADDGRIRDAKTLAGLYYYDRRRSSSQ